MLRRDETTWYSRLVECQEWIKLNFTDTQELWTIDSENIWNISSLHFQEPKQSEKWVHDSLLMRINIPSTDETQNKWLLMTS